MVDFRKRMDLTNSKPYDKRKDKIKKKKLKIKAPDFMMMISDQRAMAF